MESNVKNKKQQAMPKSEAESFGIKRNTAIRAHVSICLKKKSSELCGKKPLLKRR